MHIDVDVNVLLLNEDLVDFTLDAFPSGAEAGGSSLIKVPALVGDRIHASHTLFRK